MSLEPKFVVRTFEFVAKKGAFNDLTRTRKLNLQHQALNLGLARRPRSCGHIVSVKIMLADIHISY